MAQRFLGLEIGSNSVRAVQLSGSGKSWKVDKYSSAQRNPDSPDSTLEALQELAEQGALQGEVTAVSTPNGAALMTTLALPFDDPKVIEQVLDAELQGTLPISPDEHVKEFSVLGKSADGENFDVLVAAHPIPQLAARLQDCASSGTDPHVAIPLCLCEHFGARFVNPDATNPYLLVDIGARSTQLTLMEGEHFVEGRVLLTGGDSLTDALSNHYEISSHDAATLKHSVGFVAPPGEEQQWYSELEARGELDASFDDPVGLASSLRKGLKVLELGLRQTLARYSHRSGQAIDEIVIAGGGARLRNLSAYLSKALGVHCRQILFDAPGLEIAAPNPATQPELIGPLSLALRAADAFDDESSINLRKGPLAFKGSLEFLRERIISLGLVGVGTIAALFFMLAMQYHALNEERDATKAALENASSELFGTPIMDHNEVSARLQAAQGYSFLPSVTAFDHFEWMSNAITNSPALAEADLELETLDIDVMRRVVSIKGNTAEEQTVPTLTNLLQQNKCFPKEIPEPQRQKMRGRTVFQLRIDATACYVTEEEE